MGTLAGAFEDHVLKEVRDTANSKSLDVCITPPGRKPVVLIILGAAARVDEQANGCGLVCRLEAKRTFENEQVENDMRTHLLSGDTQAVGQGRDARRGGITQGLLVQVDLSAWV